MGNSQNGMISNLRNNIFVRQAIGGLRSLFSKKVTMLPTLFLLTLLLVGLFGPFLAPYDYTDRMYDENGELIRSEGPSLDHPLGTTDSGYDILSRVIIGARPTVLTGVLGGGMIISIGLAMGVTSGYVGGNTDNVLMRVTDIFYSFPLIPFALVLIAFFGIGFFTTVFIIGIILWRGNARVLRSQVLQIKERPFVQVAKSSGAGKGRIITKHIVPNIASMAVLFFSLGMGYAIIAQAGLAFIGASDPFVPSWGVMIRNAYDSGYLASQPAWGVVPGILLGLTVASSFMLGREFETDESEEAIAAGRG